MAHSLFAFLKRNHVSIDRNILTYGICVIIATILWFLNALNKDYTAEISYPVKYTDFPKGKHLISELPKDIILEVNAKGFALLGYKVSTSFLPITFNVNTYSKHKLEGNGVLEYTVNTREIMDKISNQLSQDIKLQNITPETIEFRFSRSVSRKIAIYPVIKYSLKKQYILKDKIQVTPDSILISGPSNLIDTMKYVYTNPLRFGEISKKVSDQVDLVNIPGVDLPIQEVTVQMDIEKFTESKKNIILKTRNLPDSLNIRLFPENINITYEVGLSKYDKITDADFEFSVDYEQCLGASFLTVKIDKVPSFIQNLVVTTQKVEYILEEKIPGNSDK